NIAEGESCRWPDVRPAGKTRSCDEEVPRGGGYGCDHAVRGKRQPIPEGSLSRRVRGESRTHALKPFIQSAAPALDRALPLGERVRRPQPELQNSVLRLSGTKYLDRKASRQRV